MLTLRSGRPGEPWLRIAFAIFANLWSLCHDAASCVTLLVHEPNPANSASAECRTKGRHLPLLYWFILEHQPPLLLRGPERTSSTAQFHRDLRSRCTMCQTLINTCTVASCRRKEKLPSPHLCAQARKRNTTCKTPQEHNLRKDDCQRRSKCNGGKALKLLASDSSGHARLDTSTVASASGIPPAIQAHSASAPKG